MNNKLIRTDTIWYKIKSFFSNIFRKKELKQENIETKQENLQEVSNKTSFKEEVSYREEIKELERKESVAQELLTGEVDCEDLTEQELDEMTEYFIEDIKKQEAELQRIKIHIMEMKRKLQNS